MSQIYNNMEKSKYLKFLKTKDTDTLDSLSDFYLNEEHVYYFANKKIFQQYQLEKLPLIIQAKLEIYEQEY